MIVEALEDLTLIVQEVFWAFFDDYFMIEVIAARRSVQIIRNVWRLTKLPIHLYSCRACLNLVAAGIASELLTYHESGSSLRAQKSCCRTHWQTGREVTAAETW
jgi:hypothetical protein